MAAGWGGASDLTEDRADAGVAFLAADWMAERQLEKTGAFLEELSRDEPSFNTGFAAEGVAAAWRCALARSEPSRASRYARSWKNAAGFIRTFLLDETDVFPFRAPKQAVGGVRCTASRAAIRIDQVSHSLHAFVEGYQNLLASRTPAPADA